MTLLIFGLTRRRVVALVFGLAMIGAGAWLVQRGVEMAPVAKWLVNAGLAIAIVGAALVIPGELSAAIRTLSAALLPLAREARGVIAGTPPAATLPDPAAPVSSAKAYLAGEDD